MLPIKTTTIYCIWAIFSGSLPFGFFIIKLSGMGDVRNYGSGNIGATNVMRTGGNLLGAITLLLDALKGFLPIFLAKYIGKLGPEALTFVILAAVIGHMFTPWLKFRGGKGVATATGAILAYNPIILLPAIVTFFITLIIFDYISLSSIVAVFILFLTAIGVLGRWITSPTQMYLSNWLVIVNWATLTILITIKHIANIKRIFYGTESKYRTIQPASKL